MDKYDYMFRWLKNATKQERHIDEMESFAKKHPIIFMQFHKISKGIVVNDESNEDYIRSKERLTKLFNEHEIEFDSLFKAVKERFNY